MKDYKVTGDAIELCYWLQKPPIMDGYELHTGLDWIGLWYYPYDSNRW